METDPGIWINLGVAYSNKGNLDEARKAYEKALSLDDKNAAVYNNLAAIYLKLSQKTKEQILFERSIEYFKKAIERDPSYASPYKGWEAPTDWLATWRAQFTAGRRSLATDAGFRGSASVHLGSALLATRGSRPRPWTI